MGVAVTGQMGWVEGKRGEGMDEAKKGRGIACEKSGGKSIDNFLTQSRVKERNEKHQKRKKERKDQILLVYYGTYSLFTFVIYQ